MTCLPESAEQELFVAWLDARGYAFTSVPNSTYTTSLRAKARNTREGLRPGFPDLVVCLKKGALVCVEMKRATGGRISPVQAAWHAELRRCGIPVGVCRGRDAAIAFIQEQEHA